MVNDASEIGALIRGYVIGHFSSTRKEATIEEESPLLENGIIDSLGVQEVIRYLEATFEITIFDEDMLFENFQSIAGMTAFVTNKLNSQLSA